LVCKDGITSPLIIGYCFIIGRVMGEIATDHEQVIAIEVWFECFGDLLARLR